MTLTQRQQDVKDEFIRVRGTWSEAWDAILRLDPDFLAAYLKFSAVPWRKDHLEPKVKELIYCAFDASATQLYIPGLKVHMRNAIRYGTTPDEIMEVLDIASVIGIHTATVAAPILAEELQRAAATPKAR